MKKLYSIFAVLIVLSLTLSACVAPGEAPDETFLDPTSVEAQAQQAAGGSNIITVNNRLTVQEEYDRCVANTINSPVANTDLFGQDATLFECNGSTSGLQYILVPAGNLAKITPTMTDDTIVKGIVIMEGLAYALVAVAVGTAIGETLVWESHSNREHNPNIKGTKARANIEALLLAMAAYLAGTGNDPRNKCGVTKDAAGFIVRVAIWVSDASHEWGGYLMWYYVNTPGTPLKGPWGGSYDISSENFDMDRMNNADRQKGYTWTPGVDCNSVQTPGFLQAAQP